LASRLWHVGGNKVEEHFQRETESLRRAWMKHDRGLLRDYLVQDVEDPRINVQSLLARHFLIGQLLPGRFAALAEHELRFALAMNWLLAITKSPGWVNPRASAVLGALVDGAADAEGMRIPRHVAETFTMLPAEADGLRVPDYLSDALAWMAGNLTDVPLPGPVLATFQVLWRSVFDRAQGPPIRVLEPACGSANDYRFLDAFGVARFLDYTGLDLGEKNIRNARAMFPGVRFEVGNVLEIPAADKAFDCFFVHDLFEHLSIGAMERAVAEVCRVASGGCVGFFSMHGGAAHVVRPAGDYYVNLLSAPATEAVFRRHGASVEAVCIDAMLRARYGGAETHNKNAYTFLIRF
jgi:SAM-dependent methyltransferase